MAEAALTDQLSRFRRMQNALSRREWTSAAMMVGFIVFLHVLGFAILFLGTARHYHIDAKTTFGIGTGVLAYTLGSRHAFDADHISAIDNTTRKLMAEGKRPLSVGFFFSIGHSTVVFIMAILLNFGIRALNQSTRNPTSGVHHYTELIGTLVSGSFLYIIAMLNIVILVSIVRVFLSMRRGVYDQDEMERQLNSRGMMSRFFSPMARRVDSPWKMYLIGLLFGLGFDTATEAALLVLAGSAMVGGLPFWAVLSLPILFSAGMSLFDTADGVFMNFAYSWAFFRPVRKVYYNITITGLSVAVAFVIGTIELLSELQSQLKLAGGIWSLSANFNINHAGFFIVGVFIVTWCIALSIWHFGHIEESWEQHAATAHAAQANSES